MEPSLDSEPVRIFLIGLSESFARSLARYVGGDARIALTGVAPSFELGLLLFEMNRPDLALVDWAALKDASADRASALRAGRPGLRIVCVTDEGEAYRSASIQAGADAVISKAGLAAELEALLRQYFPRRAAASGSSNA